MPEGTRFAPVRVTEWVTESCGRQAAVTSLVHSRFRQARSPRHGIRAVSVLVPEGAELAVRSIGPANVLDDDDVAVTGGHHRVEHHRVEATSSWIVLAVRQPDQQHQKPAPIARTVHVPLRAWTVETLIGLLAVIGLRVSEVICLDRGDVDTARGVLTVRNTKFGKTRLVPLHASTRAARRTYVVHRNRLFPEPGTAGFFISTAGTRLRANNLRTVFAQLQDQAGVRTRSGIDPG